MKRVASFFKALLLLLALVSPSLNVAYRAKRVGGVLRGAHEQRRLFYIVYLHPGCMIIFRKGREVTSRWVLLVLPPLFVGTDSTRAPIRPPFA